MANKERGEVELAFGSGEEYTLRLSLGAIATIESNLDLGINDIATLMSGRDFGLARWRVLLWGALREFHPCSIEQAGEIMGRAGLLLIVEKLGHALMLAFPRPSKSKERAARGTRGWQRHLRNWLAEGYPEALFWASTLRQVELHLDAATERKRLSHNDRAWLAYNIFALPLMKPRPTLRSLQIRSLQQVTSQTPNDRLRMAQQVAAMGSG